MVIKMSCANENCQEIVEYLCKDCIETQFLCKNHYEAHTEVPNSHKIKKLENIELDLMYNFLKEMKIDHKISEVMKIIKILKFNSIII